MRYGDPAVSVVAEPAVSSHSPCEQQLRGERRSTWAVSVLIGRTKDCIKGWLSWFPLYTSDAPEHADSVLGSVLKSSALGSIRAA